jgi:hypothetical protein
MSHDHQFCEDGKDDSNGQASAKPPLETVNHRAFDGPFAKFGDNLLFNIDIPVFAQDVALLRLEPLHGAFDQYLFHVFSFRFGFAAFLGIAQCGQLV